MEESSTYQAILQKGEVRGRIAEAQRLLLRMSEGRLGKPSGRVLSTVSSINSLERLEALVDRVFQIETWDELLASV